MIELVIKIPEEVYEMVMNTGTFGIHRFNTSKAIRNGKPLPKGHGNLKDELDLDLTAPSLGTDEYIYDLMAKHNVDYMNGDDEDKVRTFAMDLIHGCNNVIETAPTIIEAQEAESEG